MFRQGTLCLLGWFLQLLNVVVVADSFFFCLLLVHGFGSKALRSTGCHAAAARCYNRMYYFAAGSVYDALKCLTLCYSICCLYGSSCVEGDYMAPEHG